MRSEFDFALEDYIAQFEKEGRLSTLGTLYILDFLEIFVEMLVEENANAPMDKED